MSLTSQITAQLAATVAQTVGLVSATLAVKGESVVQLESGTASGKADLVYHAQRTITASSSETLDFAGSLTDSFGATLTFVKVKAIFIKASSGNTNDVVVGNTAATQFTGPLGGATHTIAVAPNGVLLVSAPNAGWAVGAGSTDMLKIANSAGGSSVTYDIVVIGTSA
jgi:hypothetical protein